MNDTNSQTPPQQTTEQDNKQIDYNRNPTGAGGFGDNPQNINFGGRPKKQETFTYWYNQFKNMTVSEFAKWEEEHPDDTRTVACSLAYARVVKAREDLKEFQEVANRSEGMPKQTMAHEGEVITGIKVEIVKGNNNGTTAESDDSIPA